MTVPLYRKAMLLFTIAGCIVISISLSAQQTRADSIAGIDSVLFILKTKSGLDNQKSVDLFDSIFSIAQAVHDTCRQIDIKVTQAADLDVLGNPEAALDNLYWARSLFPNQCDSQLFIDLQLNLGSLLITIINRCEAQ